MQKRYRGPDYLLAFLVTVGCSFFILYPVTIFTSVSCFCLLLLLNIDPVICTLTLMMEFNMIAELVCLVDLVWFSVC